jgi:hypothetical protein
VFDDVLWCPLSEVGWLISIVSSPAVFETATYSWPSLCSQQRGQLHADAMQRKEVLPLWGTTTRMRPCLLISALVAVFCNFLWSPVHCLQHLILLTWTHVTQMYLSPNEKKIYEMARNDFQCFYSALTKCSKSKAIFVTGRGGLQGCEMWRIPHFLDSRLRPQEWREQRPCRCWNMTSMTNRKNWNNCLQRWECLSLMLFLGVGCK